MWSDLVTTRDLTMQGRKLSEYVVWRGHMATHILVNIGSGNGLVPLHLNPPGANELTLQVSCDIFGDSGDHFEWRHLVYSYSKSSNFVVNTPDRNVRWANGNVGLTRIAVWAVPYGWPKWTKSAKGSTYEKFHVRKHTRIKSFVYKTIRVSKVSCIKWYAYQKFRV